ncbi:hypothetical protein [Undibacterium sp. WLX3042]|uniref:hypothetical protein n=1 Tax=Undibacterium sp. WLX3042 TaxID=3412686 RepID=UPI003C2C8632
MTALFIEKWKSIIAVIVRLAKRTVTCAVVRASTAAYDQAGADQILSTSDYLRRLTFRVGIGATIYRCFEPVSRAMSWRCDRSARKKIKNEDNSHYSHFYFTFS